MTERESDTRDLLWNCPILPISVAFKAVWGSYWQITCQNGQWSSSDLSGQSWNNTAKIITTYRSFREVADGAWPLACDKNIYGWFTCYLSLHWGHIIKAECAATFIFAAWFNTTQVHYLEATAAWIDTFGTCINVQCHIKCHTSFTWLASSFQRLTTQNVWLWTHYEKT